MPVTYVGFRATNSWMSLCILTLTLSPTTCPSRSLCTPYISLTLYLNPEAEDLPQDIIIGAQEMAEQDLRGRRVRILGLGFSGLG